MAQYAFYTHIPKENIAGRLGKITLVEVEGIDRYEIYLKDNDYLLYIVRIYRENIEINYDGLSLQDLHTIYNLAAAVIEAGMPQLKQS